MIPGHTLGYGNAREKFISYINPPLMHDDSVTLQSSDSVLIKDWAIHLFLSVTLWINQNVSTGLCGWNYCKLQDFPFKGKSRESTHWYIYKCFHLIFTRFRVNLACFCLILNVDNVFIFWVLVLTYISQYLKQNKIFIVWTKTELLVGIWRQGRHNL